MKEIIKKIFIKIAHLDMEDEFMSAEDFCDGSYEEAEHLYRSLPGCIVNVIARDYLDGDEVSEILKTVKFKHKKVVEEVEKNPQIPIKYKPQKKRGGCNVFKE